MLRKQSVDLSKMKLVSLVKQMKGYERGTKKLMRTDTNMINEADESGDPMNDSRSLKRINSKAESVKTIRTSTKRNSIVPAFQQTLRQCASSGHEQLNDICPASVFVDYKKLKQEAKNEGKSRLQPYQSHHQTRDSYDFSKFCPSINFNNQRLVAKNGECNVNRANIKKRRQRYMADIFTTLIDIKWRWNLLNFVLAFILSWLIFALLWWLIAFSHGDFDVKQTGQRACVEEVQDFTTALLFSIETQQTIGYGSRHTNSHCSEAILVMMFQSCFGVIIQVRLRSSGLRDGWVCGGWVG